MITHLPDMISNGINIAQRLFPAYRILISDESFWTQYSQSTVASCCVHYIDLAQGAKEDRISLHHKLTILQDSLFLERWRWLFENATLLQTTTTTTTTLKRPPNAPTGNSNGQAEFQPLPPAFSRFYALLEIHPSLSLEFHVS